MEVGSYIDLIRVYLKMGDLGRAEEAALGAVALDPHHDRCKRALADVFAKVGRLADAVRLAREATQKAPGDAEGHAFLGHMCLQNDDLPGAEAAFRSALRLAPDSLESKIGYAEALLRQSRTAEIKSELECWLEEEQTNARLHAAFGKALSAEGDFEQARTSLLRAVQLEPTNVQYLASLAHVLRQMGKVAEAVTELRRALEIDPANGHLLAALGAALAHDGRLDEAELCFSRALNFDPLNVPWHRSLADTLLRLEKLVDAEKVICDALRLSPDDSQALHLRARLEMSLKAAAREPESVGPTSMAAFN